MWSVRIGYRGLLARRYFVISCEAIAAQWFLIYRARTPGYRGPTSREDATATPPLINGPTIVDAVNERSDLWRSARGDPPSFALTHSAAPAATPHEKARGPPGESRSSDCPTHTRYRARSRACARGRRDAVAGRRRWPTSAQRSPYDRPRRGSGRETRAGAPRASRRGCRYSRRPSRRRARRRAGASWR